MPIAAGLAATGLGGLFDTVVTWSDVPAGRGKPAPDIFLLAARRLRMRPDRCLVYEDTDAGVVAALAAGMTGYKRADRVGPAPVISGRADGCWVDRLARTGVPATMVTGQVGALGASPAQESPVGTTPGSPRCTRAAGPDVHVDGARFVIRSRHIFSAG